MRVALAVFEGVNLCVKIGLRNVAKIARNNDIFREIDERKCGDVQDEIPSDSKAARFFKISLNSRGCDHAHTAGAKILKVRQY
jgi:hypothetical protein